MTSGEGRKEGGFVENRRLDLTEAYMKLRFGEKPQLWGDDQYHRPWTEWWNNHQDHNEPEYGFNAVLHTELERAAGKPNSKNDVLEGVQHVWDLITAGKRARRIDSPESLRLHEVLMAKLEQLNASDKLPDGCGDVLKIQKRKVNALIKSATFNT